MWVRGGGGGEVDNIIVIFKICGFRPPYFLQF